ncbi:TPA: type I restriction enzyme HsdR N-terminal domain-containing protein [Pseudomonas aeruginosa]|nr:type I restriction enzyme HsdR N-terminal domain-containing protein [Pseudomonas aeruginosa]EIU3808104.1 type I restriction enzyme HsdR N-terminal domain-containing protein [Pseudomonas aeruginosa]EIU3915590.1 type I restriction enzyme HsdR N-terminal domain-containing protein [Pseudomonas aeruginosa]EIU3972297.1 type I restriction enzyme HsdR N-terminal domain-containing protein [Pseudomonas aeruginosa]ELC8919006.1 type I restriction enzyme HsdR N-terminal domain-containing protein [Pseudom
MSKGKKSAIPSDKLDALDEIIKSHSSRDINEAETRHKIIDFIIHDFLNWPKNRVSVEEYISPGFADYVLKKNNGDDLLFIEAKRAGVFFELPIANSPTEKSSYISIRKLTSDPNIKAAMEQVRTYCFDTGCEYACITNGLEWIFFKTFEKGKRWETLQAFVVRSLEFFKLEYTKAINSLSFTAIIDNSSLPILLSSTLPKDRTIFFPKEKIPSYSHTITANRLASKLRPIINRYFGVIKDSDTEFMERCYVSQREYQGTSDGMRSLIQDSLSPYFQSYGVQQLEDTGKGGRLGGRLTKNIKENRRGEVLVLFGGKGAGKSTFIKRLLHHHAPRWLREHSAIAIIDLLNVPEDIEVIRKTIWSNLVSQLDLENLLNAERETLITELFSDRFEVAKRQDLSGLPQKSESYNIKLNTLVATWKADLGYCAERLVERLATQERGAIIVIDNTDQYSSNVQDFCFSSAQEISDRLKSVTLISMREERFYDSKIHGVLDAFQNSGFHISSPKPAEVFKKRLDYTVSILLDENKISNENLGDYDANFTTDSSRYLKILSREFSNYQSPLNQFLSACAHGDIRLSLDLFRSFLLSGYTNVEEMISYGTWTFKIHQVIKPVMIPNRYFYDESVSDIPNIYQIRSSRHGSHFTSLRILRKISKGVDPTAPQYTNIAELRAYFAEIFGMIDDFEQNLDVLLKHGFIESNNRLDSYSDSVDSIKITSYGLYMLNDLAYYFTYLDLICTDCGIFNETTSNYLTEAAKTEYNHFLKGNRLERVKVRLERVKEFLEYIRSEELREKELYSLGMPDEEMFTSKAMLSFTKESTKVMRSAKRQKF